LTAWPPAIGAAWTALALGVLWWAPRRVEARQSSGGAARSRGGKAVTPQRQLDFPAKRGALLIASAAAVLFWLLRERIHLFGDGALLIRDKGFSETVSRAPLLVYAAAGSVSLGARAGVSVATSLALLSLIGGMLAVFCALRLAAVLTPDRGGRWLATTLLLSGGCMALFFGHVEYYALPAAALVAYLWLACWCLDRGTLWPTWIGLAILLPLHLEMLALVPGQLALGWTAWRRGERRTTLAVVPVAALVAWAVTRLAGSRAGLVANTIGASLGRYVQPYFETTSTRHAFGFASPAHALAFANDLLLVAPMAVAASPAILWAARPRQDGVTRFLAIASIGCLLFSATFSRELGPYRDWDILAPFGFVYLAWVSACFVRPHPGSQRVAIVIALVGGLFHLVPFVMMQISPRATRAHIQTVLTSQSQWSPHARGYMYEELAIEARQRGDEAASLHLYEAAVAANPSDARYHTGLGTRYVKLGELDRAAAEFTAALSHRPDYAPAHNNLAVVLLRQGRDLEAARQHVAAALRTSPDNPDYLTTAAEVERRAGNHAAARSLTQKAAALRAGDKPAPAALDTLQSPP